MIDRAMDLPPTFESAADAQVWHATVVRRLAGQSNIDAETRERLANCSATSRCRSEACPMCRRLFRRRLLLEAVRLGFPNGVWTRASIIPADMHLPVGRLDELELPRLVRRVQRKIQRSTFADTLVIGGLDISLNIPADGEPGYQWHLYLLVNRPNSDELRQHLQDTFAITPGARRGLRIGPTTDGGFLGALSYAYKNGFVRRSQYRERSRLCTDGSPRLNNVSQSLTGEPASELDALLLPMPVGSRLILHNARRVPMRRNRWRLHPALTVISRDADAAALSPRSANRQDDEGL